MLPMTDILQKKIANSILYFSENKVEYYKGTYEEYEENKNKII